MSEPSKALALQKLSQARQEIESIDNDLVELLARRLRLGHRIAELKRIAELPILDPTREAAVIRRVTTVAREAGLPTEPVREVFWQIVGMSRRAQEESEARARASSKPEHT